MRALASLAAAALPVWRDILDGADIPPPPIAVLTLFIRRLLRRLAALRWMAPLLAARSSAATARWTASWRSAFVAPFCASLATLTARATSVLAAARRG